MKFPTKHQFWRRIYVVGEWAVIASRVAIMLTSAQWLLSGNQIWFTIGMVSVALTYAPHMLIQNAVLRICTKVCISLLLGAHIVLGMHFGLYESSVVYDKLMHLLGSSAFAGLIIVATIQYCNRIQLNLPPVFFFTLVFGITISGGVLWEIFEFAIDRTDLFYAQRGLHDTMLDLIANTVGVLGTTVLYMGFVRFNNMSCRYK